MTNEAFITACELFTSSTKYDILSFIQRVGSFSDYYNDIIEYYTGKQKSHNSQAFSELNELVQVSEQVKSIQSVYADNFGQLLYMYELYEILDEIYTKLQTIDNTPKWFRSCIIKNNFNENPQISYILPQNTTLEDIAESTLFQNRNDWSNIAISNDLKEIQYTPNGQVAIELSMSRNVKTFDINSVVDVISGKSIYGKDIAKQLTFNNDDLLTLSYDDTLRQSVDILFSTKTGDNPAFPQDGIPNIIGNVTSGVNFIDLTKKMSSLFSTDDTLNNFTIQQFDTNQDVVTLTASIQTIVGTTFDQKIII